MLYYIYYTDALLPFDTNIYGLSKGFRWDVLNNTIQTMWNLNATNPIDKIMSVLSFPHQVSSCILLYLVTARVPSISNIAVPYPQTVSNLTASSSLGARYPFYLLFTPCSVVPSAGGSDIIRASPPSSTQSWIQNRIIGGTLYLYFFSGLNPRRALLNKRSSGRFAHPAPKLGFSGLS